MTMVNNVRVRHVSSSSAQQKNDCCFERNREVTAMNPSQNSIVYSRTWNILECL